MKKIIYLSSVLIFLGLFIASPYVLDYLQFKSALKATGDLPCTDGLTTPQLIQCTVSCNGGCCTGGQVCMLSTPPCLNKDLSGKSESDTSCAQNYLATIKQATMVDGQQNVILGGTTMTMLSVVASDIGCDGCTSAINSPKVYAFKNKMKSFFDYIIAGFKD